MADHWKQKVMTTSPAKILDLLEAFRRSKVMFAAVALGLFERKPVTDTEVRLAQACVSLGLLNPDFSSTPDAAQYLRRDSPDSLVGYIDFSNRALWQLWGDLEGAVQEGTHRWAASGTLFSNFYETDEAMREYLSGLHGFGRISSPQVASAFDLSRFKTLVDLGGATGHLSIAIRHQFPKLRCVLFDLPRVIGFARSIASGIEFAEGDFFADPLPPADLYALVRILHDWPEEKIRLLLEKVYRALPSGGALLIAEKLMDDDQMGPVGAHLQSLNMLVCAEGRERSLPEYETLLRAAGFTNIQAKRTGSLVDAILAEKP